MLKTTRNSACFVETLLDIGFHTLSLMNSTLPSTIWDKASASYARALAKYSMSEYQVDPENANLFHGNCFIYFGT